MFNLTSEQIDCLIATKENTMETITKEITMETYKTKYGYHPCSKETFFQIKKLRKAYWQTLKDFCRWNRWNRKEPQNRCGDEPKYNEMFIRDWEWSRPSTKRDGSTRWKSYPKTVVDHDILNMYEEARRPSATPNTWSSEKIELIEKMYDQLINNYK